MGCVSSNQTAQKRINDQLKRITQKEEQLDQLIKQYQSVTLKTEQGTSIPSSSKQNVHNVSSSHQNDEVLPIRNAPSAADKYIIESNNNNIAQSAADNNQFQQRIYQEEVNERFQSLERSIKRLNEDLMRSTVVVESVSRLRVVHQSIKEEEIPEPSLHLPSKDEIIQKAQDDQNAVHQEWNALFQQLEDTSIIQHREQGLSEVAQVPAAPQKTTVKKNFKDPVGTIVKNEATTAPRYVSIDLSQYRPSTQQETKVTQQITSQSKERVNSTQHKHSHQHQHFPPPPPPPSTAAAQQKQTQNTFNVMQPSKELRKSQITQKLASDVSQQTAPTRMPFEKVDEINRPKTANSVPLENICNQNAIFSQVHERVSKAILQFNGQSSSVINSP